MMRGSSSCTSIRLPVLLLELPPLPLAGEPAPAWSPQGAPPSHCGHPLRGAWGADGSPPL
eukprot:654253-Alexandrium_andersonii.AAC.1